MLTNRELMTVRAALLFWQEEMCPHDAEIMLPYFESAEIEPLTSDEIDQLRRQLVSDNVAYALLRGDASELVTLELFPTTELATNQLAPNRRVATVIGVAG